MKYFKHTIFHIFAICCTNVLSDSIVDSSQQQSTNDEVCAAESCEANGVENKPESIRMITKEELAMHDGNQTETLWLSIMSKVFDVSAGPEYYSEKGPYRVFVGRDANVPFITGTFNKEEADKSLLEMEPHQLYSLEHWSQFYYDEAKYPFVGLLIGELYDNDGNPTETLMKIKEKIEIAKIAVEERKKKTAEIIARRKREAAEKKKRSKQ